MSGIEITVRPLVREDGSAYREIRLEGLKRHPAAFGSTYEIECERPLSWFEERRNGAEMFGAFKEGQLLGIAGFVPQQGPKEAHKGHLIAMYVRPEARKLGVGRRLAEAVIDHARGRVEILKLCVIAGNEPARRLYAKLGFTEYGVERNALKQAGRYYDEVLMAMPVSP